MEVTNKLHYLSSIVLFRDLSQAELAQMDRQFTMTTCRSGKIFYTPEESGQALFLLKKGRVQLYRLSPEGKKLVVGTLGPGAVFGEMSLVGQGMHNTFAEAVDSCVLCVMSRADVERLLQEKPSVAFRLLETMSDRLGRLERRLEEFAFKSVPARLAGLLLRLAGSQEDVQGYTHQQLADMLGTHRETVTLTLNEFRSAGYIEIGRKQLTICDRQALARLAGE